MTQQQDIFYEIPRLPMFCFVGKDHIERIRALRYVGGNLKDVLLEGDLTHIMTYFQSVYEVQALEDPCDIFYCIYKKDEEYVFGVDEVSLRELAETAAMECDTVSPEDFYEEYMASAKKLHIPMFESKQEARDYVFGTK